MARHLAFCEREFLYRLLKARKPKAEIAKLMGRSRSTIYPWIAQEALELRTHLRRQGKRRSGPEKGGQLVGCTSIEGRPKVVDSRCRFGDWQGDTIVSPGRRSGLVTMVACLARTPLFAPSLPSDQIV